MLRHGRGRGLSPSVRRPRRANWGPPSSFVEISFELSNTLRDLRQRAWEAGRLLPRTVWLAVGKGTRNRLLADSNRAKQHKLFQRRIALPPDPRAAQLGALRQSRVARCVH